MAMADMSDDEAPQLKAIEQYLDSIGLITNSNANTDGGRLKVDFGWLWTTDADTRKAVAAARSAKE
jgi:hypothetical protein